MSLVQLSRVINPGYVVIWLSIFGVVALVYQITLACAGVKAIKIYNDLGALAVVILLWLIQAGYFHDLKGFDLEISYACQYLLIAGAVYLGIKIVNQLVPSRPMINIVRFGLILFTLLLFWVAIWPVGLAVTAGVIMCIMAILAACCFFIPMEGQSIFQDVDRDLESWYEDQLSSEAPNFNLNDIPWEKLSNEQVKAISNRLDKESRAREVSVSSLNV